MNTPISNRIQNQIPTFLIGFRYDNQMYKQAIVIAQSQEKAIELLRDQYCDTGWTLIKVTTVIELKINSVFIPY